MIFHIPRLIHIRSGNFKYISYVQKFENRKYLCKGRKNMRSFACMFREDLSLTADLLLCLLLPATIKRVLRLLTMAIIHLCFCCVIIFFLWPIKWIIDWRLCDVLLIAASEHARVLIRTCKAFYSFNQRKNLIVFLLVS